MDIQKMETLFEEFYKKRLSSMESACNDSPLSCLNSNELSVLNILSEHGPLVMGRLAENSRLAMSTLTGITDKLNARGLLSRNRDESDKRIVRVSLSKAGRQAFETRMETRNEVCRDILAPLSEDEITQFLSLMEKIIEA